MAEERARERGAKPEDVVGSNLRALRLHHGLTLSDVSDCAGRLGKSWSTGSIAGMEGSGSWSLTVSNLVCLSAVLTELTGTPTPVSRLLQCDEPLMLAPHLSMSSATLLSVLAGNDPPEADDGSPRLPLADHRAARRLGMSDSEFRAICDVLWGHPLSIERDRRVPQGATAQKSGRMTRQLMQEVMSLRGR